MGVWIEPNDEIENWYTFIVHRDASPLVKELRVLLTGPFSTLRHHIYVKCPKDATYLRLRGHLTLGNRQRFTLDFVDDHDPHSRPLLQTELNLLRHKKRLRGIGRNIKAKLVLRYPGQQFRIHYRLKAGETAIAVEATKHRQMLLDPQHRLSFLDFAAGWARYMQIAGLSSQANIMRRYIFDSILPDNWKANEIGLVFGVASHHVRLTLNAHPEIWDDIIESSVVRLRRTLTWDRRHIDVYGKRDEEILTPVITPYLEHREPDYTGPVIL